jgi:hypothetical protein
MMIWLPAWWHMQGMSVLGYYDTCTHGHLGWLCLSCTALIKHTSSDT